MKHLTRLFSLLLALTAFACMAMGSGSSEKTEISDSNTVDGSSDNQSETSESTKPSIENTLLINEEKLKITATEYINDSIFGDGIKVLLENNEDYDISVGLDALIVNDYMISDLFMETIAAGKKVNSTIYISSHELNAAGIDTIGQIELYFKSYKADDYQGEKHYPVVTIKTTLFDQMDVKTNDMGIELYSANGVKIIGKYVEEDTIWGSSVLLYLENKSGKNLTVSCSDLSVNGFMVTGFLYSNLYDGKMAIDEIDILQSTLSENGIENIENIELKFIISNQDDYSDTVETDIVTINVAG